MVSSVSIQRQLIHSRGGIHKVAVFLLTFVCGLYLWQAVWRHLAAPVDREDASRRHIVTLRDQLTFIPRTDAYKCDHLFQGGDGGRPLPADVYQERVEKFQVALKAARVNNGKTVSAQGCEPPILLTRVLQAVAKLPFVTTICDVGFSTGHNAFTFLASHPKVKVVSFALTEMPYTRPMFAHLREQYPDRINVVANTTEAAVRTYFRSHVSTTCDLVLFGGCHSYTRTVKGGVTPIILKKLMKEFLSVISYNNVIVVDETSSLYDAWSDIKEVYNITDHLRCKFFDGDPLDRGIAVGSLRIIQ